MSSSALDADALEDLLEEILWAEASSKRTAAEALASLTRPQQEFVLRWVQTLEKDNIACAYQFLTHAHRAMRELENDEVEAWIIQGLDVYDRSGLYAAVDVFRNVDKFLARAREAKVGAVLDDYSPVLERVVLGFSGRRLRLQGGERTYTDTETLFLPEVTARFETREDNFRFLKATATYIWAQTRFGTWKQGVIEALTRFDNETRALRLFHMLESLRLDARIAGELPGIHRDMAQLNRLAGQALCPPDWEAWRERLGRRDNRVEDSLALVAELLPSSLPVPNPLCYQGEMLPEQVEQILRERLEDEKAGLRSLLVRYKRELEAEQPATERKAPDARETPFSARTRESAEHPGEMEIELLFHDQPVSPPEDVGRVISSIMLDLGELPPDYLVPAGDGSYKPKGAEDEGEDAAADVWSGAYHERGARLYKEWDFRRQSYRKNWCVMRELSVQPQFDGFVRKTMDRYSRHLARLRKTFEALRGEDKWLKKEPYGDEVDIDALVEAHADAQQGLEMSERLFTRLDPVERNIAVMFIVDMSGSTRGWINKAERESLLLLCEALETLGDRYAIYGFSGMTRKRCKTYRIKVSRMPTATTSRPASPASRPRTTRAWAPPSAI